MPTHKYSRVEFCTFGDKLQETGFECIAGICALKDENSEKTVNFFSHGSQPADLILVQTYPVPSIL
jgi:hypothetical protein